MVSFTFCRLIRNGDVLLSTAIIATFSKNIIIFCDYTDRSIKRTMLIMHNVPDKLEKIEFFGINRISRDLNST